VEKRFEGGVLLFGLTENRNIRSSFRCRRYRQAGVGADKMVSKDVSALVSARSAPQNERVSNASKLDTSLKLEVTK